MHSGIERLHGPITMTAAIAFGQGFSVEGPMHRLSHGTSPLPTDMVARFPETGNVRIHWEVKRPKDARPPASVIDVKGDSVPSTAEVAAGYLAAVRSTFGVSIKSLAEVLRVERATVYGWIRKERNPQSSNMEQLSRIHSLAVALREVTTVPIPPKASHVVLNGRSLVDLLGDPNAGAEDVKGHVQELLAQRGESTRGRDFRSRAEELGIRVAERDGGQERLDLLTAKVGES